MNESETKTDWTPLPIYKRPKHDKDNDIKEVTVEETLLSTQPLKVNGVPLPSDHNNKFKANESSLKPHEYLVSKMDVIPKGDVPELKLFENMEVDDDSTRFSAEGQGDDDEMDNEDEPVILSPAMKRLMAVLNYYNSLMIQVEVGMEPILRSQFIEFCDRHYGQKYMLEDYIHFVTKHSDLASTKKMAATLKWKCFGDLKRCGMTTRHFRDRRTDKEPVHFYIETMDKIHFNVLHLVDVGLRVDSDSKHDDNQNEDNLVDETLLKMSREIHLKREQSAFERLDATGNNSKFTLCSTLQNDGGAKGGVTKMDSVLNDVEKEVGDKAAVHRVLQFMKNERFDTETMNDDMAVYAETKESNVFEAMKGDAVSFGAFRRWLRYHRVSGSSFSTGKWWAYWKWYRTQTVDSLMSRRLWKNIDFGGHSMESLCVYPFYENLKEEALESGLIPAAFWKSLVEKATRYLEKSTRCKNIIYNEPDMWDPNGSCDYIKFGVPHNYRMTLNHLLALLLYTDSTKFCTALSETFRAIKTGETIEEMNSRNSKYYWTSMYLREMVYCFGDFAGYEERPYFTGLSYQLHIPQFQIGLIGPTSTSMAMDVALRFAGESGMLLILKGGKSRCFDASWLSAYPEEEERIFCGSTWRETVTSIVLMDSGKNYKVAIGAFSKFDALVSGQRTAPMKEVELEIIKESLRWVEGREDTVKHKKLDLFILDTFYSLFIHKKLVYLDLDILSRVCGSASGIVNLMMHPLWAEVVFNVRGRKWVKNTTKKKPEKAKLMKPLIFNLFRNVHQISIKAGHYSFDFILFLKMIRSVDVPKTLEYMLIEGKSWIDEGFAEKEIVEYAAEGITAKKENNKLNNWSLKLFF